VENPRSSKTSKASVVSRIKYFYCHLVIYS